MDRHGGMRRMIRFDPIIEPPEFDAQCRKRGLEWLQHNPNAVRPRDFWGPFKSKLADGFRYLCAYSAIYEPVGTVDHYISCAEDISKAYEWSNYRYAAAWINSCKQNVQSSLILDPFEVNDEWFEIILPSLQLVISQNTPESVKAKAEYTLERLHLRDDERILRQRNAWYQSYCQGKLTLEGLRAFAPLIARAVEKSQLA
jgi:hypothetical protein